MQFATKEDIEAPLDRVFAQATNYDHIERQVMRHGIDLRRTVEAPGAGRTWVAGFRFRGKDREAQIVLSEEDAPNRIVYTTASGGLDAVTRIEFVALSRARTRVGMEIELLPRTLSARLLVQSLKLARGTVEKRFQSRIAAYAREMEERLRRG